MPGIISGDEKLSHTVVSILTSTSSSISFISNFLFHLFYYCFTCGVCWGGCGGMSHMLWWMDRGQMTALGSPFSSACLFMTSGDGTLLTRLAAAQPVPCLLVKLVLRQDRSELIWSPDWLWVYISPAFGFQMLRLQAYHYVLFNGNIPSICQIAAWFSVCGCLKHLTWHILVSFTLAWHPTTL